MPVRLSQRAYAARRGVTHRAVQKALSSGRIVAEVDGRIDPARADEMWVTNTRQSNVPPLQADLEAARNYAQARRLLEHYRAELARLDYQKNAGELVEAVAVYAAAFERGRRARDILLRIPDLVSPIVVGLDDRDEVHRVIAVEVERAVRELAGPLVAQPRISGE
jgi:phage terminase Nu1 subunit (DNA packaging protein)